MHIIRKLNSSVSALPPTNKAGEDQRLARHLCQRDVARRWGLSERTLEKWRASGRGPKYIKLGGRVAYPIEFILEFERKGTRTPEAFE